MVAPASHSQPTNEMDGSSAFGRRFVVVDQQEKRRWRSTSLVRPRQERLPAPRCGSQGSCRAEAARHARAMISVVTEVPPCTIVIEACTGAFYWARRFEVLGHQVKIISPQYVKPLSGGKRTTAMTWKQSPRQRANRIFRSFRRRPSSNRITRRCTVLASAWSSNRLGKPDARTPARPRLCVCQVDYPGTAHDPGTDR